jgi:molecular chaperone Hsp33
MVNTAQQKFQYSIKNKHLTAQSLSTYGKAMTSSTLLSSLLKGEERIRIEITGTGTVAQICTESIQLGETRGFMIIDDEADNSEKTPVLSAAGAPGIFSVSKILYNNAKPVISSVRMDVGNISQELSDYFKDSEQVPTASYVDTVMYLDDERNIKCLFSYGMLVQALPMRDGEVVEEQKKLIQDLQVHFSKYSKLFQDKLQTRDQSQEKLFYSQPLFDYPNLEPLNPDTVRFKPVDFMCRCNLDGVLTSIASLGRDEIIDMERESNEKKEPMSVTCDYCNNKYPIGASEFKTLHEILDSRSSQ